MRLIRLLTLVLVISLVFLIMFLDINASHKNIAKAVDKNIKAPAAVAIVHLK